LALQQGCNFLCVCQPDAHPTLDERWAFWQAHTAINALETRRKNGRCTAITRDR
jgi:hypothetical protein